MHRHSAEIHKIVASDLVSTVAKEITLKKEKLEMFEEKLSKILRSLEGNTNSAVKPVLKDLKMLGKNGKKKGDGEKDWLSYHGLMLYNGDPDLGEARIYFDSVSTLRDEIFALEDIEKALKKLLTSGMKDETRCSILFKDGMPVKLVLRPADKRSHAKISLEGNFRIQ